ncbi:BA75_03974T0 [Komagataella pastoris]|uniref:Metacaspase-1 n=1 Tax=Komagataella pastoris TaxID=4922 RepID=A0A1B2JEA1_PICPA|nr:BA75_03974T0 [Komagataella pastoris]
MFPGRQHATYSSNQEFQRPPAAPPTNNSQQFYRPPVGPPPAQNSGYNVNQYQAPSTPPSNWQKQQYQAPPTPPTNQRQQYQQASYSSSRQAPQQSQYGQYQTSDCTGRKKALLVGINYFGTSSALNGCINDVQNMKAYLINYHGYKAEDMVILTDDQKDIVSIPNKQNMIAAMQWLVSDARPNDSLVFHYSGHGGRTEDLNGDEVDGFDDVIYPLDFKTAGHIVDDDLHDILVKPLPMGCRLTAIFDSCHSGTCLDVPFTYRAQDGQIKEYNVWKESGSDAMQAVLGYAQGNMSTVVKSVGSMFKKVTKSNSSAVERIKKEKFSPADVIAFSGCKDTQTSADTVQNGTATGAMSWAFISVLTQNPNQSYLTLLQNIRNLIGTKYSQKPQMSSSHPMDLNTRFIM